MRKLLVLLLATLLVSGCGLLYRQPVFQGNLLDKTAVDQLQAGMDRQQVMVLLGTPSIRDPFHHDRWDYVASQRIGRTGKPEVKTMTLWFENGQLSRNAIRYFGPNLAKDKNKRRR